jgi:hypothetical protein
MTGPGVESPLAHHPKARENGTNRHFGDSPPCEFLASRTNSRTPHGSRRRRTGLGVHPVGPRQAQGGLKEHDRGKAWVSRGGRCLALTGAVATSSAERADSVTDRPCNWRPAWVPLPRWQWGVRAFEQMDQLIPITERAWTPRAIPAEDLRSCHLRGDPSNSEALEEDNCRSAP